MNIKKQTTKDNDNTQSHLNKHKKHTFIHDRGMSQITLDEIKTRKMCLFVLFSFFRFSQRILKKNTHTQNNVKKMAQKNETNNMPTQHCGFLSAFNVTLPNASLMRCIEENEINKTKYAHTDK